ncbi:MAG: YcaO-like family protein [Tumebacillaceae bacterium]
MRLALDKAEEILARVRPLARQAGITRVSDITGLDKLGLPVFLAVRPDVDDAAISVYNGKGLTAAEAELSAIMEGIERYSGSTREEPVVVGSYAELKGSGQNVLDPRELILSKRYPYDDQTEYEWVRGKELMSGQEMLVPANCAYFPYYPPVGRLILNPNTDGLAAGNSVEGASVRALLELVERDASSLSQYQNELVTVEESTIDADWLQPVLAMFKAANIDVYLKNITSDIGLPVFSATTVDAEYELITGGYGCHFSRDVALFRALVEAAQTRLTIIHGAREDLDQEKRIWADAVARAGVWAQRTNRVVAFQDIPTWEHGASHEQDLEIVLGQLRRAGLDKAIIVELTKPNVGVPVVRAIVPGLEDTVIDPQRIGRRARAYWKSQNA